MEEISLDVLLIGQHKQAPLSARHMLAEVAPPAKQVRPCQAGAPTARRAAVASLRSGFRREERGRLKNEAQAAQQQLHA